VKRIPTLARHDVPRPQAHLIPIGGAAKVPTVGRRVLLAGDSAGFAEPLLAEGIYFAILSGQIAAEFVEKACGKGRFDKKDLDAYERRCRAVFGVDFDVAYHVARFSNLQQYDMERVARFFFADRKVQECMIRLIDGSLRYRDAQTRLAWPYFKYRLAKLGLPFYS
jgi:flavin-dependent dehydrogenase